MIAEVSEEQVEKLGKEVGFDIDDQDDLEQAISILIEINSVE